MSCHGSTQRGDETHDGTNLDALDGQFRLAFLHEIPAGNGHHEDGSDDPCRDDRVAELVDGKRREGYVEERYHLVAHGVRIELATNGILHPCIGHQNPPGGNRCAQACEPCGGEMEAGRDLLPAEEHHGHEGGLHKECHDALDGQWRAEDIAYEPRVVRPVGAEFKLKDDTCGNTHGEIDAEEFLPELCAVAPKSVDGIVDNCSFRTIELAIPNGLADTHDDSQSESQRNEQPMVDGCQCELCSCPVDGASVDA